MARRGKATCVNRDDPKGVNLARYGSARLVVRPHLDRLLLAGGRRQRRRSRTRTLSPAMLSLLVANAFIACSPSLSLSRRKAARSLAVALSRISARTATLLVAQPLQPSGELLHATFFFAKCSPVRPGLTPLPLVAHGPTLRHGAILPNAFCAGIVTVLRSPSHGADRPRALGSRADARRRSP